MKGISFFWVLKGINTISQNNSERTYVISLATGLRRQKFFVDHIGIIKFDRPAAAFFSILANARENIVRSRSVRLAIGHGSPAKHRRPHPISR